MNTNTDGMFVIILPVVVLPAIYILHHNQSLSASSKRRQFPSVPLSHSCHTTLCRSQALQSHSHQAIPKQSDDEEQSYWQLIKSFMVRMDFGGLSLIGLSFALLLLPLTLAKSGKKDWTHRK